MNDQHPLQISLRPWTAGDLVLLTRLLGDPALTAHLGGPETEEQLASRHERYLRLGQSGNDRMLVILTGEGERV